MYDKVVLAGRKFGQTDEGTPCTADQGLQHRAPFQEGHRNIRAQVIAGILASQRSRIDQVTCCWYSTSAVSLEARPGPVRIHCIRSLLL